LPDTALLILHGLPSISLHMLDIAFYLIYSESGSYSAPFHAVVQVNTCAGFSQASALEYGVSGSL